MNFAGLYNEAIFSQQTPPPLQSLYSLPTSYDCRQRYAFDVYTVNAVSVLSDYHHTFKEKTLLMTQRSLCTYNNDLVFSADS